MPKKKSNKVQIESPAWHALSKQELLEHLKIHENGYFQVDLCGTLFGTDLGARR